MIIPQNFNYNKVFFRNLLVKSKFYIQLLLISKLILITIRNQNLNIKFYRY